MYSLFFAGTLLEQVIGRWRFALLYLGSGIAGSAGALALSPGSVTVGASGAIFGILGALFVLERRGNIATGGQIAGLIVLNLDLHVRDLEHLGRRPHRRADRRRHPDVAAAALRRSMLQSVGATAAVIVGERRSSRTRRSAATVAQPPAATYAPEPDSASAAWAAASRASGHAERRAGDVVEAE